MSSSRYLSTSLLLALLVAAPVAAQEGARVLTAGDAHEVPVGSAATDGDTLVLRGDAGVEQAVVIWPVSVDADELAYARVAHEGLAPSHELSFYFRAADGDHFVPVPATTGPATIELHADHGWRGRISAVGLVYGPAGNIPTLVPDNAIRIGTLALQPPSTGARLAAQWTQLWRIAPWVGSRNHVLARSALVAASGAAFALALLLAVRARPRARRAALASALAAFALVEFAIVRQWLVLRGETAAIAQARAEASAPPGLDWQLVHIAERLRAAAAGRERDVAFALSFEDAYVSDRLRFHMLPLRARRDVAYDAPDGVCLLSLGDRAAGEVLWESGTAFGPVVLSLPPDAGSQCRWISSR